MDIHCCACARTSQQPAPNAAAQGSSIRQGRGTAPHLPPLVPRVLLRPAEGLDLLGLKVIEDEGLQVLRRRCWCRFATNRHPGERRQWPRARAGGAGGGIMRAGGRLRQRPARRSQRKPAGGNTHLAAARHKHDPGPAAAAAAAAGLRRRRCRLARQSAGSVQRRLQRQRERQGPQCVDGKLEGERGRGTCSAHGRSRGGWPQLPLRPAGKWAGRGQAAPPASSIPFAALTLVS